MRWYSDGELIAQGADLTSLDLNEYEDKIGCYVRFTLTGNGGVLYSQAFPVKAEGVEIELPTVVPTVVPTVDAPLLLRITGDFFNLLVGWTPILLLVRYFLWGTVRWM